jgi:penicillin-binding protein 1A
MQGAFVMANVETGGIEVAVGSKIPNSQRNRAFSSKRQMGSTFKPIVYAAAFQQKHLPSARVVDKQYDFADGSTVYSPNNYESVFMGDILLRYGLIHSLNNTTVMLAQRVGLRRVHQMAVNMGFDTQIHPYFSTALGSFPTTPMNVAEIYATLANFGETKELSFIKDAQYGGGMTYVERKPPKRAMDKVSAYQTMYIMQDIPRIGTARRAGLLPGTAAKTGTSDQSRDVWTAAICYPYVIVVWIGYDTYEPMDEKRAGGNTAAPVTAAFQREYFGEDAIFHIQPPEDVVFASVRVQDGTISEKGGRGTYVEAFRKGNLPKTR